MKNSKFKLALIAVLSILTVVFTSVGLIGCGVNYPIYKKLLEKGKAKYAYEIVQLAREISGIFPSVRSVVIARGASVIADSANAIPCISVIVRPDSLLAPAENVKLAEWLRVRLSSDAVVLTQQCDSIVMP